MTATIHRIDLTPPKPFSRGRAEMRYGGELLGVSGMPLFAAARLLKARGVPDGDVIETWRGETPCLRAKVGVAAGLSVSEPDARSGPWIVRWWPPGETSISRAAVRAPVSETPPPVTHIAADAFVDPAASSDNLHTAGMEI